MATTSLQKRSLEDTTDLPSGFQVVATEATWHVVTDQVEVFSLSLPIEAKKSIKVSINPFKNPFENEGKRLRIKSKWKMANFLLN